jgi:hypothetical protein
MPGIFFLEKICRPRDVVPSCRKLCNPSFHGIEGSKRGTTKYGQARRRAANHFVPEHLHVWSDNPLDQRHIIWRQFLAPFFQPFGGYRFFAAPIPR